MTVTSTFTQLLSSETSYPPVLLRKRITLSTPSCHSALPSAAPPTSSSTFTPTLLSPPSPPPAVIHSYSFNTRCDRWCCWEDRWVSRRVPACKHRPRHGCSHAVPPSPPLPPPPIAPTLQGAASTGDGEPCQQGHSGFQRSSFTVLYVHRNRMDPPRLCLG